MLNDSGVLELWRSTPRTIRALQRSPVECYGSSALPRLYLLNLGQQSPDIEPPVISQQRVRFSTVVTSVTPRSKLVCAPSCAQHLYFNMYPSITHARISQLL